MADKSMKNWLVVRMERATKILIVGVVAFFVNLGIPTDVSAQGCVQCKRDSGGCWQCRGASPPAGKACTNVSCNWCTVSGLCDAIASGQSFGIVRGPMFNDLVENINADHSRFAVTVILLAQMGQIEDNGYIFWTPVPIASSDIHWWLNREEPSADAYFAAFDAQARKLNKRGVRPVKYRWFVEQDPSVVDEAVLKIEVIQGSSVDPGYKSMQVRLVKEGDGWKLANFALN